MSPPLVGGQSPGRGIAVQKGVSGLAFRFREGGKKRYTKHLVPGNLNSILRRSHLRERYRKLGVLGVIRFGHDPVIEA